MEPLDACYSDLVTF